MTYTTTTVNDSAVIVDKASADLKDVRGLALKLTKNGVALAGAGEMAIGVGVVTNSDDVKTGDDVHVQVKKIGMVRAGAAFDKGAELGADASGMLVAATAGKAVVAIALQSASAKGELVSAQLVKYVKATA